MLYQKSSTLGNVACCHVVSELTTKSTCSECDIVFLEGICILQERCQVFLPGDLRRSYLDEEGHVMRRPSFLDTIAVGVASTGKVKGGGGGGESEEDSSSSTTLVPFLQQVVNTMGTGTSTAPLRRLAIRRMFELHSMEAAPGASLKKRRKEARNEMKKLTSFVFDCGGIDMGGMEEESTTHHVMNLVASNIQLLCKYASDEHLDAFLRWLIDFNCLEKEMKEERREEMTNGTGEGRQRVRMLLKTSFYELRPIRARMFDVLTSTLRNSLLHAFFNAKTSKGDLLYDNRKKTTTKMTKKTKKKRKRSRQDNEEEEGEEEASSSSSSSWLSTTLTSTTTHPTFAAFVEARGENDENTGLQKFLQLSVPDLKPMRHHLEQAQNVIQLVLGLPAGYLQDDINLESFVSLVLELDVLCSCSSDLNSVQSYLGTTRHALARLSSTHTTTVAPPDDPSFKRTKLEISYITSDLVEQRTPSPPPPPPPLPAAASFCVTGRSDRRMDVFMCTARSKPSNIDNHSGLVRVLDHRSSPLIISSPSVNDCSLDPLVPDKESDSPRVVGDHSPFCPRTLRLSGRHTSMPSCVSRGGSVPIADKEVFSKFISKSVMDDV